jgi:hypothetical protein
VGVRLSVSEIYPHPLYRGAYALFFALAAQNVREQSCLPQDEIGDKQVLSTAPPSLPDEMFHWCEGEVPALLWDCLLSRNSESHCEPRAAVAIEPSLRSLSPQNGNIRGVRRRLLPKWPASSPFWEFRDQRRIAKARQQRAFLLFEEWRLRPRDWLAGGAVLIAPVSKQIPCYQGI